MDETLYAVWPCETVALYDDIEEYHYMGDDYILLSWDELEERELQDDVL